ncbi:carboxypeptidase [Oceanobacillus sp. E9]|uniref:M14 family zinc carboxypeptidase n=1 Tax=Oceanobacillus TaxID=182709 RepID=UPI00084EB154|nr:MULTISPECIES: M14 family zinc carboxypeptidase [Oceanobacillus]OEH53453.1 carboxypeptidase [Oceanobacillus sp. E9]
MNHFTWKKRLSQLVIVMVMLTLFPLTGFAEENDINMDPPLIGFEQRDGETWTTHEEEIEFLEEVATLSDRVSYSQIGTTVEGRPLHLVRVGFPEPPSDEDIANGNNMLVIGTQHGNEGAPREMALKLLRDLAFTDDEERLELLQDATILFIPTANPDGREADTRSNAEGIDINREHLSLRTLEVQAIASVLDEFNPDITVDGHERPRASGNPDIEMLWPRNLNVDEQLRSLNQEMVEDHLLPEVEGYGFSTGLYGTPGGAGGGDERIMRNMLGLRNGLGLLTETAGLQEPNYRVDAQMRTVEGVLSFYYDRFEEITSAVSEAPERQASLGNEQNQPFYLDGADNWEPTNVIEKKPTGYLLTNVQVDAMEKHMNFFSLEKENVYSAGEYVTMSQPKMGVIPFLFDKRATYNEVEGIALYNSQNVGTATNMSLLVDHFANENAFTNTSDVRTLKMQLTAVDRFEKKEDTSKVNKHLNGLIDLLNYQSDNDLVSEDAAEDLMKYALFLKEKWLD